MAMAQPTLRTRVLEALLALEAVKQALAPEVQVQDRQVLLQVLEMDLVLQQVLAR